MEINSLEDLDISKILKTARKNSKEFDFKSLAEEIMNKICISNGAYKYHPIEIEFYIYDKEEHPDIHVYPRDNKKAGDLFFHLSGMDICFESSIKDSRFGGILIRALEREDKNKPNEKPRPQFGGPLTCKDEVLNTATEKCIVEICKDQEYHVNPKPLIRKGLDKSKENDSYLNKEYRFFREDIKSPITRKVDSFKFNTNELKKETIDRKYYF